jgi:hypothetical protein
VAVAAPGRQQSEGDAAEDEQRHDQEGRDPEVSLSAHRTLLGSDLRTHDGPR